MYHALARAISFFARGGSTCSKGTFSAEGRRLRYMQVPKVYIPGKRQEGPALYV